MAAAGSLGFLRPSGRMAGVSRPAARRAGDQRHHSVRRLPAVAPSRRPCRRGARIANSRGRGGLPAAGLDHLRGRRGQWSFRAAAGSRLVSRTRPWVAGLARPAIGAGQLSPQGGRGRAVHDGLDTRNVAVSALRDAPPLSSADRVCRLAAAAGADAPRRAARGGGDRRGLQQPRSSVSFSVAAGLRLPGASALAVSRDAPGDRACPRLLRPPCAVGGAADRQAPSARQRVGRLGRDYRLPGRRARDRRPSPHSRRRRFGYALGAAGRPLSRSTARSALWRLPADCR